jgi:hypothetical protein
MKKLALIFILSAMTILGLYSCGPNQKELEKQKRTEDSLNKLDSDNSFDEANKLLMQADSIEKAKKDSADLANAAQKKK